MARVHLTDLPDEILYQIFAQVPSLHVYTTVCKRTWPIVETLVYRDVALCTSSIWHFRQTLQTSGSADRLANAIWHLRLGQTCTKHAQYDSAAFGSSNLCWLLKTCRSLKQFDYLHPVPCNGEQKLAASVASKSIRSLAIGGRYQLFDAWLPLISACSKTLVELHLHEIYSMYQASLPVPALPRLEHLKTTKTAFTETFCCRLIQLVQFSPNLSKLSIDTTIPTALLIALGERLVHIRCSPTTDLCLHPLPLLKQLELVEATDEDSFSKLPSYLRCLYLNEVRQNMFLKLLDYLSNADWLRNLEELAIGTYIGVLDPSSIRLNLRHVAKERKVSIVGPDVAMEPPYAPLEFGW